MARTTAQQPERVSWQGHTHTHTHTHTPVAKAAEARGVGDQRPRCCQFRQALIKTTVSERHATPNESNGKRMHGRR